MGKVSCPCCDGQGLIDDAADLDKLTPSEKRLLSILSKAGNGISIDAIVDRMYAHRDDGGPDWAKNTIHVIRHNMKPKLTKMGVKIHSRRGPGAVWMLVPA